MTTAMLAASAQSSCGDTAHAEFCTEDDPSLMQTRLRPGQTSDTAQVPATTQAPDSAHAAQDSAGGAACRKLVVFYDGTWNELDKPCDWLPSQLCETNIAAIWRLAKQVVPSLQLTKYEPGVGWSGGVDDNANFGVGTTQHMLNGYEWLVEQYQPCDEIFVLGFSRGALSARMLQGMIHHVGLAKKEHVAKAADVHFAADAHTAAAFKQNMAWPGVKVKFVGLFDAVLRTLLDPFKHRNIEEFALQLSSSVENLAHAIALGEYREIFEAHELYTDPATNATQMWFMGMHSDVGGGRPNPGLAHIPGGWMADEAVKAGLLLPLDWRTRPEMAINYLDDLSNENALDGTGTEFAGIGLEKTLGIATFRNPARCRKELGKENDPILVHQSVWDRMQDSPGWVPLQHCCSKYEQAMSKTGVQYVGNPHYTVAKAAYNFTRTPQWFRLSFGSLKNAPLSEAVPSNPDYFLRAVNWHDGSSHPPRPHEAASNGWSTALDVRPPEGQHSTWENLGSWWSPNRRGMVNFAGASVILPYEATVANEVLIELYEEDLFSSNDFLGRAEIRYSDFGAWLDLELGDGAALQAKAEPIFTDREAQQAFGNGDYAVCQWLDRAIGLSRESMCSPSGIELSSIFGTGAGSPTTCEGFVEDTKTGAF